MSESNFENENVKVEVSKKENCLVEYSVKSNATIIKAAKNEAIKEISKGVEVPGFRKGKAPVDLILKDYADQVDNSFKQKVADLSFVEAQKLTKIPLLKSSKISFDLKKLDDNEMDALYIFETEPSPPSIDPKLLDLSGINEQKISQEDIDEYTRQMLFFYAKCEEETEKAISADDFIILDLESLKDEKNPSKVFSNTRFEVAKKSMAKWMMDAVIGMKKEESKEVFSEPDDHLTEDEKKNFETQKVRITIKKIEKPIVPEFDEEFAKKIGAPSLDEVKKSIVEMLEKQTKEKYENEIKVKVNQFLIEKYPFDLPLSLVEKEKDHRKSQILKDEKAKVEFSKLTEDRKKQFDTSLLNESVNAIKLFYLSRKILEDNKIVLSEAEVKEEAEKIVSSMGKDKANFQEYLSLAASRLLLTRAQDYVIANAKK